MTNVIQNSFWKRAENIVGKGQNAGYQNFLPFPSVFSKALCSRVVKPWDCVVKSQTILTGWIISG